MDKTFSAYDIKFSPGDVLVYKNGEVVSVLDNLPNQMMRCIHKHTGEIIPAVNKNKVRRAIKEGDITYVPEIDEEAHEEGRDIDGE